MAGTITYDEWLRMPIGSGHEEVVNGEIVTAPPERALHPRVIRALQAAFFRQLDLETAEFFASPFALIVGRKPWTSRTPDIAVFDRSTMVEEGGCVCSAPQLVIEVLSPSESRKDISEKLSDYECIGAAEVWLASPEAATVEILLLEDGKFRRSAILAEGILKPKHFPAVQIDISEIWPD